MRPRHAVAGGILPALVGTALFVLTLLLRLLSADFGNDHFMHLVLAQRLVHGELPVRDFLDPGLPLTYALSAAAQWIAGQRLLGEALLTVTLLAVGSVLVFHVARRASGSTTAGIAAALLVVATAPRLYNYPKIVVYTAVLTLMWRYGTHAGERALAHVAGACAVSFLLRFDHGSYTALGLVVLVVVAHVREGWAIVMRRLRLAALVFLMITSPYLAWVAWWGGLTSQIELGLRATYAERQRTRLSWPIIAPADFRPLFSIDPAGPRVVVRWANHLDDSGRRALESRYALFDGRVEEVDLWEYTLVDTSRVNVLALLNDPAVVDTARIDRATASVSVPLGVRIDRWIPLRRVTLLPRIRSETAAAILFYVMHATPLATLLLLAYLVRHSERPAMPLGAQMPALIAGVVMCVATNLAFLRAPLVPRIADAAVLPAILGAWCVCGLVRLVWHAARVDSKAGLQRSGRRWAVRLVAATTASVLVLASSVVVVRLGFVGEMLRTSGLHSSPARMVRLMQLQLSRLALSPPVEWLIAERGPSSIERIMLYLRRCTTPEDRLLVTFFGPEFYYFSDRLPAGREPYYLPNYFDSPVAQERSVRQVIERRPPIVLLDAEFAQDVKRHFGRLYEFVSTEYAWASDFPDVGIQLVVDARRRAASIDPELGLPCFRTE